nr:hypothetical protein [Tanacetum cinerariifolium]
MSRTKTDNSDVDAGKKGEDAKDADEQVGEEQAMDEQDGIDQPEKVQAEVNVLSHKKDNTYTKTTTTTNSTKTKQNKTSPQKAKKPEEEVDVLKRLAKLEKKVEAMLKIDDTEAVKDSIQANVTNEMSSIVDFTKFFEHCLKKDKITKADLEGIAFKLLKGNYKNSIELEYNMEQCYLGLTYQIDSANPEGDRCPYDLSKPPPF